MIKRYLLFAGANFDPNGGWSDFRGSYDTLDAAIAGAKAFHQDKSRWDKEIFMDWYEIVDLQSSPSAPDNPVVERGSFEDF